MKFKDVDDFLKTVKRKKTFGMHFSTHDPLLWFLWKQVQRRDKGRQASKKVSYMIVKSGLLSTVKKYYPELYDDFKATFFFDDDNFHKWRLARYSDAKEIIQFNLESVYMKIMRKKHLKRGGVNGYIEQEKTNDA